MKKVIAALLFSTALVTFSNFAIAGNEAQDDTSTKQGIEDKKNKETTERNEQKLKEKDISAPQKEKAGEVPGSKSLFPVQRHIITEDK
ncbi:MAG: hypothetical protein HGA78_07150 [Nitrospirales bacterium]|nr:hypothetical protein [Nitrospirales bacterium]